MSARHRVPSFTVVLALLAGLLVVFTSTPAVAVASDVTAGTLHWGIKESWRNYIGSGVIMSDGVTRAADGAFDFPVQAGSFDDDGNALTLQLSGTVRFAAYCEDNTAYTKCLLDSTFSKLSLLISADHQELRGDYDGISRDTPGGEITHYSDVVIATINSLDATPSIDGGTTNWPSMPTVAGDGFPLYPVGTTMDPVSLSYEGPGGAPDLGEHWSTPGTPAFTPGATWAGTANPANREVLVGAGMLHVVERASTTATQLTVLALHPETLAPSEPVEVPLAANATYVVANDPASDRIFVATQVSTRVGGVRGGDAVVRALTWLGDRYEVTTLGTVSGTAFTLNAMTWNTVAGELAFITQVAGTAADRFTLTRVPGGTGAFVSVPIVLSAPLADTHRTGPLFSRGGPKSVGTLLGLRDGSYLAVGGLSGSMPLPARHLVAGAQSAAAALIEGSVPTVQPFAADYNQYFNYELATRASDGSVLLYGANWTGVVGYVDVVDGVVRVLSNNVPVGVEGYSDHADSDAARGLDYMLSQTAATVDVLRDQRLVASIPIEGFARDILGRDVLSVLTDGSLIVQVFDATKPSLRALQRLTLTGVSPMVLSDPADHAVTLPAGVSSATISFQATGTGGMQWQMRPAGASRFSDIAGETSPLLALNATLNTDGTQVRAVFANAAGTVVSAAATMSVRTAPLVESPPAAVTVYAGQPFELSVLATGNPAPTVTWQRQTADGWADVTSGVSGTRLTVTAASASDNGALYRAKLANEVDTVYTTEALVTVRERPSVPETTTYTGVSLEWSGSPEWQHRPPNGSSSNYFSAGVSDGTPTSYQATVDGVEILQRAPGGETTAATWATRGSHIDAGGAAAQLMRFTGGTAVLQSDGSATIQWTGAASINFYDGLVPFTLTNPAMTIDASGTGTLTADLSGYSGDMANPDKPKEPVVPQSSVTLATFHGVVIDAERGFVATPDFDGVLIDSRGGTPQLTTGAGWGAWPQSFIDFHATTNLAAYFYSTGGSMDAAKRPASLGVGFSGAGVPSVPETPVITPPVLSPSDPTTVASTKEGSLLWGVRSSFRSYITGSIAKGSISVSHGASAQGGLFRFGQTSTDWSSESSTATTSYGGSVTFLGHAGVLNLTFADPVVRIDSATSGTLLVTVNGAQAPIGALDLTAATQAGFEGGVAYANVPVTLTQDGARVFSYGSSQFYPPGTAMDPLSFVIGATASPDSGGSGAQAVAAYAADSWTPPATPPTNTGLYITPEQLKDIRPGSELTVVGAGFRPNEADIKVVLYSEPVVLERNLIADAAGTATWTGIIPLDTQPGTHTLTFQGSQNLGIELSVKEPNPITGCAVNDATVDWGFKESFRSYISGTIAHGAWEVTDGATYQTPSFGWAGGQGLFDHESFAGRVSFQGAVRFTGHDGLLDTAVKNPTILFTGTDTAYLLLDVQGLTMDDALAGKTENVLSFEQVSFAEIDLSAADVEVSEDGATVTVTDAPTSITSQGFEAFPNYEPGTEFDPISFVVSTASDCAVVSGDAIAPISTEEDPGGKADLGWRWWVGGGALAVGVLAAAVLLLSRSRRHSTDEVADTAGEIVEPVK